MAPTRVTRNIDPTGVSGVRGGYPTSVSQHHDGPDTKPDDDLLDRSTEPLEDYASKRTHEAPRVDHAEADPDSADETDAAAPEPEAQEPPD
ncbi:hypothetical protein LV79_006599 [Actinokineospora globicatena]|nr:hypothetical protein [Actinokineospora globicatena]GLW82307.1 hypothetical protein Aglo01_67880 [Actinokineospora globicatena]GLW89100.1 hypothetical protein Aglo02_67390 [Actinokineospora globicatena]